MATFRSLAAKRRPRIRQAAPLRKRTWHPLERGRGPTIPAKRSSPLHSANPCAADISHFCGFIPRRERFLYCLVLVSEQYDRLIEPLSNNRGSQCNCLAQDFKRTCWQLRPFLFAV